MGGSSIGGAATGGVSTGGTTTNSGASGGGGSPLGGASGGGARSGSGGGGMKGGGAGAAGSSECADATSCEVCCDQRHPMGHGAIANTFYTCGCSQPCVQYCQVEYCGSVYYWSTSCIACMIQAPESNTECTSAANLCEDTALCSEYRSCMLGCL